MVNKKREKEIEKEIKKYKEYLNKLEEVRKKGLISEEIYNVLKNEYQSILEILINYKSRREKVEKKKISPSSIWYDLVTLKPEIAAVTSLAPVLPVSIDLGDESCFIFKTTKYPDLAKDLIYYLFKDKDEYRKRFCEASSWCAFPIFKSQMKIISDEWKKGKYKYFAVDPIKVVEAIKYFESGSWPLLERNTVCEDFREGFIWTEMIQRVVLKGEDIDKVIDEYHNKFVEEIKRIYGAV